MYGPTSSLTPTTRGESVGAVQQRMAIKWNSMKTLIAPWRRPLVSQFSNSALLTRVGWEEYAVPDFLARRPFSSLPYDCDLVAITTPPARIGWTTANSSIWGNAKSWLLRKKNSSGRGSFCVGTAIPGREH